MCHTNPFSASFGAEQRTSIFLNTFLQNDCKVDIVYIGREPIKNIPSTQTGLDEHLNQMGSLSFTIEGHIFNIEYKRLAKAEILKGFAIK